MQWRTQEFGVPNQIAWNQTMQSLIKACIAKSSCEIFVILRYYTAQSGNSVLTCRDDISNPSSRNEKSKRENRA
jgi:hypothetical protein